MQKSSRTAKRKHQLQKAQTSRGCNALCCSCRLSVSSSSSNEQPQSSSSNSSSSSGRFPAISSLSHAMVQERLEQMIREREEVLRRQQQQQRHARDNSSSSSSNSKFIVMVAMEKCSYDPREDFRESIQQMIVSNRICDPKDLRRLLNCYVSMNSEESQGVILEAFHDVCTTLFLSCKYHESWI